jgi:hypothetical protein
VNAPVSLLDVAAEKREESRRVRTLNNMRASLHAIGIELGRIQTLGNRDRAAALRTVRARFAHLDLSALSLQTESEQLAVRAANEDAED